MTKDTYLEEAKPIAALNVAQKNGLILDILDGIPCLLREVVSVFCLLEVPR